MSTEIDEKKLADSFANGDFKRKSDNRDFKDIAKQTKDARINLRLTKEVLYYFQEQAAKQGIPYQTLINSALFKIANGQLIESDVADLSKQLQEIKKHISNINLKKEA